MHIAAWLSKHAFETRIYVSGCDLHATLFEARRCRRRQAARQRVFHWHCLTAGAHHRPQAWQRPRAGYRRRRAAQAPGCCCRPGPLAGPKACRSTCPEGPWGPPGGRPGWGSLRGGSSTQEAAVSGQCVPGMFSLGGMGGVLPPLRGADPREAKQQKGKDRKNRKAAAHRGGGGRRRPPTSVWR